MYLIRRGEKPRPVCVECRKAGPEGLRLRTRWKYRCDVCYQKLVDKRLRAEQTITMRNYDQIFQREA